MMMYGVSGAGPKGLHRLLPRHRDVVVGSAVRPVSGRRESRPQESPDRRYRGQREPRDERGRRRGRYGGGGGLSLGAAAPLPDNHRLLKDRWRGGKLVGSGSGQESSEKWGGE